MARRFRQKVNKFRSARRFNKGASRTKRKNFRANPMRGGWRL